MGMPGTGPDANRNESKRALAGWQFGGVENELKGDGAGWKRALRGYALLPHLVPVVVVELATVAFAIVAWGGVPPWQLLVPLLFAMLGGQLAIGALNEL